MTKRKTHMLSEGALFSARSQKKMAWKHVKALRQRLKEEPLGGNRHGLQLELLIAESDYRAALARERAALQAVQEQRRIDEL